MKAPSPPLVRIARAAVPSAAIACAALAACTPAETPPSPADLHAVVRLRRTYEGTTGQRVEEACRVAGQVVFEKMDLVGALSMPRTDSFRVPPGSAGFEVNAAFVHSSPRGQVVDASCSEGLQIAPADGGSYQLDFLYRKDGTCSLTCAERIALPDGSLGARPCPSH